MSELAPPFPANAGFLTTPAYLDHSGQELLRVSPVELGIQQHVLYIPGYSFGLAERADNFDLVRQGAICLAECKCDVVGQVGTNWVHCDGTSPDDIRRRIDEMSAAAGIPVKMAGQAIVDALNELGARRIAVANAYYRDDWRDGINGYLEAAGFELATSGNLIDQGLYGSLDELLEIEAATHWCYPDSDVVAACVEAWRAAPDVDAVVQTGAGFRTVSTVAAIEDATGVPLVSSDLALYWAMLGELDLGLPVRGFGTLLGTL